MDIGAGTEIFYLLLCNGWETTGIEPSDRAKTIKKISFCGNTHGLSDHF
jgi:hypothetical protein